MIIVRKPYGGDTPEPKETVAHLVRKSLRRSTLPFFHFHRGGSLVSATVGNDSEY